MVKRIGDNHYNRSGADACRFIQWHIDKYGRSPSYRDIGAALKIGSTATVFKLMKGLERNGRIKRSADHRSITVVPATNKDLCKHDWRTWLTKKTLFGGDVDVVCLWCGKETQVEYAPDPQEPTTWLRFSGKA